MKLITNLPDEDNSVVTVITREIGLAEYATYAASSRHALETPQGEGVISRGTKEAEKAHDQMVSHLQALHGWAQ